MVMDVIWRRLCVSMILGSVIICLKFGMGETGKYLFRAYI